MSSTVETVGDQSEYDTSKLPDNLQHEEIRLFRDMSMNGMRRSYQIVFDQSWMPFDYDIPDGWKMHYARTEYHPKRDNLLLDLVLPSHACLTIVLSELAEEWQCPDCDGWNYLCRVDGDNVFCSHCGNKTPRDVDVNTRPR